MTDLLEKHDIKFIKWDMNRTVTEPGMKDHPLHRQKEIWIRHVQSLYEIWAERGANSRMWRLKPAPEAERASILASSGMPTNPGQVITPMPLTASAFRRASRTRMLRG